MKKMYYQDMFLKMVEPLKPHYSKDCAHLELGAAAAGYGRPNRGKGGVDTATAARSPEWRDSHGFCGGWFRTGPAEARMKVFCRFTGKASLRARTRSRGHTGGIYTTRISGWSKWLRSATGS